MRRARYIALPAATVLIVWPAWAQDGGGLIQNFLQDKLSGAGREVTISGFEGLLSGEARLGELTIADDDGVWLVLKDAVLDWNRAALLRGNLSVEELSAAELIVERIPAATEAETKDPPKAEASGFSLPELPVAIRVNTLSIARAELGETVLGQNAVLSLDGAVRLEGGEGAVDLRTERLDRPGDRIVLQGSFDNESGALALNLDVEEQPGGIVSGLAKLPGAPSLDLSIAGDGTLSDIRTDIALRTDGEERLTGAISIASVETGGSAFSADIGGDIRPLLTPEFHAFFGDSVRLVADGTRDAEGALDLSNASLRAQSVDLSGTLQTDADGVPRSFSLTGDMADPSGGPVRLPVSGPGVFVQQLDIDAAFDASRNDGWTLDARLDGLDTESADIGSLTLNGIGTISTATQSVSADLAVDAQALEFADAALAEAVGAAISGGALLSWKVDTPFRFTQLYVDGESYHLTAQGDLEAGGRSLQISGQAGLRADDLSRFSALSGQDLTGWAEVTLAGEGDVLGGQFDIAVEGEADALSTGQPKLDPLLTEPVTLSAAARRNEDGTALDRFELRSRALRADASGQIGSGAADLGFTAALSDIGLVMPGEAGAVTVEGAAREARPGDWQVSLDLAAPWDLAGQVAGRVAPGKSDVTLDLSMPDVAPLVPGHSGALSVQGTAAETGQAGAWNLDLDVAAPYDFSADFAGLYAPGESDLDLTISLPDVAPVAPGHSGAVNLTGSATESSDGAWTIALDGSAPYDSEIDLAGTIAPDAPGEVRLRAGLPDIAPLVPTMSGPVRAEAVARNAGDGLWQVDVDTSGPLDATARVDGTVGGGQSDLGFSLAVPDLAPLVPALPGALAASGTAQEAGGGLWDVTMDVDAPLRTKAALSGVAGGGATDVNLTLDVPDLSPLAPQLAGPLSADLGARQSDGGWALDLDATGPYRSNAAVDGLYVAGGSDFRFEAALPDISALAPGLAGPLSLSGTAREADAGAWGVDVSAGGPYQTRASATGTLGAAATALDIALTVPSISPFAPGVTGGVDARGSLRQEGERYAVDLTTNGPQGATSATRGSVASDFAALDLASNGTVPLGLANRFIAPASVLGDARFNLAVNGAPSLQAVSGTLNVSGARLTTTTVVRTLDDIGVTLNLNGESVQIDASANGPDGGSLSANGAVQLSGNMNADLTARLNGFVLYDPLLYRTSLDGAVGLTGPLAGGAAIDGTINVGRTEVRVPDGGLGFGGSVPRITHFNEPQDVFLSRTRAGLVEPEKKETESRGGGGGPAYGLNVRVNVPAQVFVRGRGLDIEMGGDMRITGTTAAPNPVGEIEVNRGRLDILGKRLTVDEGRVSLAGGLTPFLDISATSSNDEFEFIARISGPVDDPEFELSSVPSLPEDEVLAQFLFGKGFNDLSPLQAVQLANAIATLSGRGGVGVLGGLRDGLGLDNLDVGTNSDGDAEVRAGRYLSENVYTEVVAEGDGDTGLDINIDVSRNFTVKGTTSSSGDSSIGVYWERDY